MSYLIEFLITDSDSCVMDLNADLNLNSQEQPVVAAPKSTLDSLDCTSRSPVTVLHELPHPEMVAVKDERIESNASLLHNDVFDSSEIGASCKDYDQVTPNFDSKQKCLQVCFITLVVGLLTIAWLPINFFSPFELIPVIFRRKNQRHFPASNDPA